jgi:hypothetical protein
MIPILSKYKEKKPSSTLNITSDRERYWIAEQSSSILFHLFQIIKGRTNYYIPPFNLEYTPYYNGE